MELVGTSVKEAVTKEVMIAPFWETPSMTMTMDVDRKSESNMMEEIKHVVPEDRDHIRVTKKVTGYEIRYEAPSAI